MRRSNIKASALGGLLAALTVVIMCLGTFIPVATYICPMLSCIVQFLVLRYCGKRIAWTWYAAVCILCLLLAPDKEAAMVFLAVGIYPLIKDDIEKTKIRRLLKFLYFNLAISACYAIMIWVMGMMYLVEENMEWGLWGLALMLLLGNITFFLLDRVLTIIKKKK